MPLHSAWIVVANENGSRFLLRPTEGGALVEFVDYADSSDLLGPGEGLPSTLCRSTRQVKLKARSKLHDEQLKIFLGRVARQIDEAIARHPVDSLVLCAPSHVLAILRGRLTAKTPGGISEIDSDLVRAPVWKIDEGVRGEHV